MLRRIYKPQKETERAKKRREERNARIYDVVKCEKCGATQKSN